MNIIEIFTSIQGEGIYAGQPSVFVRLAGCDRKCLWCDTAFAQDSRSGREVSVERLFTELLEKDVPNIVVTGGEPLLNGELPELLAKLCEAKKRVTLETSCPFYVELPQVLVSMSPKLSGSRADGSPIAMKELDAIGRYVESYEYQIKFVVGEYKDVQEAEEVLEHLGRGVDRARVLLMPQARKREEYLALAPQIAEWAIETGLRFGPRLHVELWSDERGR